MKKVLLFLLIGILAAGMIACSSNDAEPSVTPPAASEDTDSNLYNDGTYTAVSDATDKGYGAVTVTIVNDEITEIELFEYNGFGDEKPESYAYEAYHEAKEAMPAKFIEANGTDVEIFTGATSSSTKWIQALERALEMAKTESDSEATYFDGTFLGSSDVGEKGRGVAWVTIENDKIVSVELKASTFEADTKKEVFKGEEYPYEPFHEAVTEMAERFVEANGDEVEIFTGATGSSTQWQQAVERALGKAAR
ncbi:FMN-binding protein [Alkaliphilus peptidifermentans]|uniref:FMN-binding domain-containing protein n=1 Tax=Alkaliphilus peptidifermentans DSM 18978 TaxID=1120976 RepID=A0A1G5FJS8_9FIRM|nr:FMN-binding protein [Alkaliphilus peptidifermentans]SCY39562.1 FMN-binding domain-containing protein [Alkaliphilus peptidifermentans DSM 18978]